MFTSPAIQASPSKILPASSALPTPSLVVDGGTVRRNIKRLAEYAARHGLSVRPHTKTHKDRKLARMQLDAGAIGLTVAKVGEAQILQTETDDLLLAYPAIDPVRCKNLARLAREKTMRVTVDSLLAIESLAAAAAAEQSALGLLVDVNVGMNRTGVSSPEDALELAEKIAGTRGVHLDGIMCYPGHIWSAVDQQAAPLAAVNQILSDTLKLWREHGFEAKIVTGGSTPTAYRSHFITAYTEIRPGTYVFNDMNTFRGGFCSLEDCAARIVCTVVSTAVKNQVVIDGGTKTFTSDICIPARDSGNGYLVEYPDAKITALSEEHGQVDISRCPTPPKLGERVTIIPNHICPCVNLRDQFYWLEEDGSLETVTVDARGKLS